MCSLVHLRSGNSYVSPTGSEVLCPGSEQLHFVKALCVDFDPVPPLADLPSSPPHPHAKCQILPLQPIEHNVKRFDPIC